MKYFSLHSTMFLLIHDSNLFIQSFLDFTFHYVSINTASGIIPSPNILNFTFHYVSINTKKYTESPDYLFAFTFHYVSINTIDSCFANDYFVSLHSTMFLLILHSKICFTTGASDFTFHYVSINTLITLS